MATSNCFLFLLLLTSFARAFVVQSQRLTKRWNGELSSPRFQQASYTSTCLNLFWFQGKDDKKKDGGSSEKRPGMGGVVSVMDSMDGFKKSQKVGKMTESIVQELSSLVVEGVAADGNVKVFVDGQQRPKGVDIDEGYLAETAARDVCSAITAAMQDAHTKSAEKMEEKMRAFYVELGLPSS